MRTCRKCGKPTPVAGGLEHRCQLVVGQLVRLPDDRTATVVRVQHKFVGDVITVEMASTGQRGGPRSFPTYLADDLRWV